MNFSLIFLKGPLPAFKHINGKMKAIVIRRMRDSRTRDFGLAGSRGVLHILRSFLGDEPGLPFPAMPASSSILMWSLFFDVERLLYERPPRMPLLFLMSMPFIIYQLSRLPFAAFAKILTLLLVSGFN